MDRLSDMIELLKKEFPEHRIGYSDHTDGIFVPIIAAAMGAKVIEKHFTLDRKTPIENYMYGGEYLGTDHVLSVEPETLKKMVSENIFTIIINILLTRKKKNSINCNSRKLINWKQSPDCLPKKPKNAW